MELHNYLNAHQLRCTQNFLPCKVLHFVPIILYSRNFHELLIPSVSGLEQSNFAAIKVTSKQTYTLNFLARFVLSHSVVITCNIKQVVFIHSQYHL